MAILNSSRSDMPRQESLPSPLIQLYKSRSTTSLPSRLTARSPGSPSRSFHIPNSPLSIYHIPENDIENIESSSFQTSRINENDDNKIHHHEKPTSIFRRRHTHRHSVGPIELKDTSCAFECCGKSLVDRLNQLSQGNIYTIVKCTKHSDDRSGKKTTKWGFFKKLSNTFKKLKRGKKEKVICGTGKYSETITVKRIKDGKKMVVKRVDKEKLTPMEYFTNAHETSCTCRSCRGLLQTESTQLIRRTRSTLTLSAHIKPRSNSVSSDPSPIQQQNKDINFAYRSASLPISTSPISENGIVQDVRELVNSPRTSVINYNNPPNTSNPQTSILIGVPLELKLLSVHSTDGLPKLVKYFSDERYYYYITKMHGVKQRKWKKPRSWHLKKYCDVYWDEYVFC
ncbi:6639_t:CDS:2 [Dentiscutata heterogama]|uniref:6639_t:CDS:1 n=1 Tax=Dentiscutata heterogama TaxID=1316150 RepID=A0ACA9M4B5_9GLOM|nr:6639_t:CDS:2 [Dentiscutata heterogama]